MTSRAKSNAADVESRKKLFRATAGLSLQQQLNVAAQLQASGSDVMQKINLMSKKSKQQKHATRATNLKYEWLHEHHHLKQLEETCARDLETYLLRLYNDASSEKPGCASSILKPKRSPRPEADHEDLAAKTPQSIYAKELEELIQLDQSFRVALLKHIASERDQHTAMKQLLAGLRQRIAHSSQQSVAAAAVTEHMKVDAKNLVFDAVIGHEMVDATLHDEFKACEREYTAMYEALVHSLKGSNQAGHEDHHSVDSMVESITAAAGGCADAMLMLELRDEFQRLRDELRDDLAAYERDFHSLAMDEDAAGSVDAARSKTGGWSAEDDDKFQTVVKNYERRGVGGAKKPELLYDQVCMVLPHRDRQEIKRHAKFHTHLRYYTEKCRDRQADHDRKWSELQAKATERLQIARQLEEERVRKQQELQQLQQQCSVLQGKVAEWRTAKDAQQRIQEQQEELERLLQQQQRDAEDAARRRRHDEQKQQLEEYRTHKLLGTLAEEMRMEEQRRREEEERAASSVVNAERVEYRKAEYERKLAAERLELQWREQQEAERLAKIDAIKQEAPYAEKLATIVADPERTRQETAAFRANVEAAEDGLPLHEKGLFPTHGYDCTTLFKNARFKLGIALREAGLNSTDYARQALASIKVANAGAYRRAVAPPTQLW